MSWLITLIVGAVVGLLLGLLSGPFRRFGTASNVLTGIAGAVVGYWLYADVFGIGMTSTTLSLFSSAALLWEIIGAIVWIAIMNAVRSTEVSSLMRMGEAIRGRERPAEPRYGYEHYDRERDEEITPRERRRMMEEELEKRNKRK